MKSIYFGKFILRGGRMSIIGGYHLKFSEANLPRVVPP